MNLRLFNDIIHIYLPSLVDKNCMLNVRTLKSTMFDTKYCNQNYKLDYELCVFVCLSSVHTECGTFLVHGVITERGKESVADLDAQ